MSSTPLYGPPKVGADILAWCTKCKMELAHVIVSMLDTKPARVQCKTCKGQHNYKRLGAEPVKRAGGTGARKAAAPRVSVRAADYWEQKMSESGGKPPKAYSPKGSFGKGDVVQHAQFGMGLVEEVRSGGKLLVIFRDGEKVLVHGLGG